MISDWIKITSLLILLISCKSEPRQITFEPPLILGHRATGSGYNSGFLENTLPAVEEALKYADGVEVDVQLSSSNTIWLYHDALFKDLCPQSELLINSTNSYCIPTTADSIIEKLVICNGGSEDRVYKLEELFELVSEYENKIISVDVKGYFTESCIEGSNVSKDYLENMGGNLYRLILKYDLLERVVIETSYTYLFEIIKSKNSSVNCHLLGYNNLDEKIERSVNSSYQGISFNLHDSSLTANAANKIREENLQLQLWTIRNEKDYKTAMTMQPFAIQVGDFNLLKTIWGNKNQPYD